MSEEYKSRCLEVDKDYFKSRKDGVGSACALTRQRSQYVHMFEQMTEGLVLFLQVNSWEDVSKSPYGVREPLQFSK